MKRKKASSPPLSCLLHPYPVLGHRTCWRMLTVAAALACLAAGAAGEEQKKSTPRNDFLIFGTVFTEQGFSFRGAEIRVRRAGEKKVRWESRADARGEFAIRVPSGGEYEMTVSVKGHREEKRKVDARTGNREDMVIRLFRAAEEKKK